MNIESIVNIKDNIDSIIIIKPHKNGRLDSEIRRILLTLSIFTSWSEVGTASDQHSSGHYDNDDFKNVGTYTSAKTHIP